MKDEEAEFLFDQFIEKYGTKSDWTADVVRAARELVGEFTSAAKESGLSVTRIQDDHFVIEYADFTTDLIVTRTGKIVLKGAANRSNEVPLRYSPIHKRLEGDRPVKTAAGLQQWQVPPRSALAVLTESVLATLEGRG